MTATTLLSLSGAQLRAEPTNPAYVAELARRQAKREAAGKVTVAALRSWGRTDEANAIVAHAKADKVAAKAAKPAPAPKAAPAPVVQKPKAVAFTRTNERVDALTSRVDSIEQAILAVAGAQKSANDVLAKIAAKLLA